MNNRISGTPVPSNIGETPAEWFPCHNNKSNISGMKFNEDISQCNENEWIKY